MWAGHILKFTEIAIASIGSAAKVPCPSFLCDPPTTTFYAEIWCYRRAFLCEPTSGYSPRDWLIQVDNVLFRVHRDIIESHSTLFSDMLRTPSSDTREGETDDRPLRLSRDLCSIESFTLLCNLLYPKKIGVLPPVLAGELDTWAPALEATQALQMDSAREYILSKLEEDRLNIPSVAARLLGTIINYEEASDILKLECIHSLVTRRGPILAPEAQMLGPDTMAHVSSIRDRIRTLAASRSWVAVPRHPLCKGELDSSCQFAIHAGVLANLRVDPVKFSPAAKKGLC
ncbi:hypothetical protein B0J17DRAFT_709591 [Rhizoctonia solani]|nr:hypothetical protein B0J17DRAFT_709591 [Rhizoctonia solani]